MLSQNLTVDLGSKRIGTGHPCFIIAEAGVNHNGNLRLAKELALAAYEAGADAVKFQTWITEHLVAPDTAQASYQEANTGREESQYELLKRLEVSQSDFLELKSYCDEIGILFLSTPDEEESANFLADLVPGFKLGSGEVTNIPYLNHVAKLGKPVILSTGMATLSEVESAVNTLDGVPLVLLHCVSNYPANPSECNLRALHTLALAFGMPVGFSDHTMGIEVSIAAAALGACVLEKHLTLDRTMEGPDHSASIEPHQLKALIQGVRNVEAAMGDGQKRPQESELEIRPLVRKTLVASRDIESGQKVTLDDVKLLRSKGSLTWADIGWVEGATLTTGARTGEPLTRCHFR